MKASSASAIISLWPVSGSMRLANLIYHVKYVSSDIVFSRCIWNHPRIACSSHLPTADRTAPVTITPVRKPEKLVFSIDGLLLTPKSQKSPQTKTTQPNGNFKNDQVSWTRSSICICLFQNFFFARKIGQQFWTLLHSLSHKFGAVCLIIKFAQVKQNAFSHLSRKFK